MSENGSEDEVMEQLQALNYIDPGTEGSLLQMIAGLFFRVSGTCRAFFKKIGRATGLVKSGTEENE